MHIYNSNFNHNLRFNTIITRLKARGEGMELKPYMLFHQIGCIYPVTACSITS